MKISHQRLRIALSLVTMKSQLALLPTAWRMLIWELMKTQTKVDKMDKQINKIKKDVRGKNLTKAKKDLSKLSKMDKHFDKEIAKCKTMKKKKK